VFRIQSAAVKLHDISRDDSWTYEICWSKCHFIPP